MSKPKRRFKNVERRKNAFIVLQERDGDCCHWCGIIMRRIIQDGGRMPPDGMTLDHIIDLCDGGSNSLENLVLACHSCNQKRSKETSKRKNQEQKELLSKYVIGTIDA